MLLVESKIIMPILIIVFVIVSLCYAYFVQTKNHKNEMRFTGQITTADFEGKIDGDDYVVVNGMQIQLAGGKSDHQNVWGKVVGIDLSKSGNEYIGKTVSVYATKYVPKVTGNNRFSRKMEDGRLTLEGNEDYFVEIVK